MRSGDDIRSLADGLARFTGEVANADPQLRDTLRTVPGAAAAADETFSGIRPSFPVLAVNLANFGRIGVIYSKSLEQALVIFPALLAALATVAGGVPSDEGGKLDFKIHLQDPPPCTTAFIPPSLIRSPADTTLRDIPPDLYCKTAQNDPSVVRGARNYLCQEFPGKRAPTSQLCRDPKGHVPLGSNPWRGPPVPYGSEQLNDPRMILPQNKFPFIPPQVDPDPGPTVGAAAAGCRAWAGSGAACAFPAAGATEPAGSAAVAVPVLRAARPGGAAVRQDAAASARRWWCTVAAAGPAAGRRASAGEYATAASGVAGCEWTELRKL
jgi:phospholipid/cholesterol/gamma-HCH transport system substrate-binding protein